MTIPVSSARRWVNAHDVVDGVLVGRDAMVMVMRVMLGVTDTNFVTILT